MPLNPQSFTAIFISESALKAASLINENVDMKLLTPTLKLIQDKYLMRLLGTGLFVDLQNKIANVSGDTLTSNDTFLLDAYIAPLMIWGVMKEAPRTLTYKYMNKGVQKMNGDTSQPPSMDELNALAADSSNNFDWYSQRIVYYLNANTQLYPQYLVVKTLDDVAPSVRGYSSPFYIGNGREGTGVCDPTFYYR